MKPSDVTLHEHPLHFSFMVKVRWTLEKGFTFWYYFYLCIPISQAHKCCHISCSMVLAWCLETECFSDIAM